MDIFFYNVIFFTCIWAVAKAAEIIMWSYIVHFDEIQQKVKELRNG